MQGQMRCGAALAGTSNECLLGHYGSNSIGATRTVSMATSGGGIVAITQRAINRRTVLEGVGVGALGLAGAALLGCRSGSTTNGSGGKQALPSAGPAGGGGAGLPMSIPVAQGTPRKGGTFTEDPVVGTFVQHDAHTNSTVSHWHVIGEKVLELHPVTAKLLPSVATSWEVADPSGLTLVFKLKPGIKMHNVPPWNGRDFTAEDVAWNLERTGGLYADKLKLPLTSFQRATMVANITKAVAVDPLTVKVTLSRPNSAFFRGVSENRALLMPKEMDDIGYKDPMKFGGIGPFQMAEHTADVRMRYTRFAGYSNFRPNEPSFDEFVLLILPDRAAQLAAFISGQIQFLTSPRPEEIQTVQKAKPDTLLYTWIDANWGYLKPNMAFTPFQDFRVRKAISLSIDYAAIADGAFGAGWGYQAALNPGFPEAWTMDKVKTLPGYNPDTKAQDRAEATKLLAAAGYANGKGIDFDILTPAGNETPLRFQAQMTGLHTDMKVRLTTLTSVLQATRRAAGDFNMEVGGNTNVPDAVLEMINLYRTGGGRNYGRFSNPDVDALLDKAISELDYDRRARLLDEFQQKFISDWMPQFVLYANPARYMLAPNIGGYDKTAGTWFGYGTWTKIGRLFYVDK